MIIKETKPTLEISMSEVMTLKNFYEIFNDPLLENYCAYDIIQILEDIIKGQESDYVNIVYKEEL